MIGVLVAAGEMGDLGYAHSLRPRRFEPEAMTPSSYVPSSVCLDVPAIDVELPRSALRRFGEQVLRRPGRLLEAQLCHDAGSGWRWLQVELPDRSVLMVDYAADRVGYQALQFGPDSEEPLPLSNRVGPEVHLLEVHGVQLLVVERVRVGTQCLLVLARPADIPRNH